MNSIEIAKKLIEENDTIIEDYRSRETDSRKRIEELEEEIRRQNKALKILESSLAREEEWLAEIQSDKKEYLVDNLALKMLIAEGGGLDMLD